MSRLKQQMYSKKLVEMLRCADLDQILVMIWAVDALQSGRPDAAAPFLSFSEEAQTQDPISKYYAHKWRLETLANEALIYARSTNMVITPRQLNCTSFSTIAAAMNVLNLLENAEDALYLERGSILDEMHRLGQRQFEWQRGFSSFTQIYRFSFIFGGALSDSFLRDKRGYSLAQLSLFCFALKATAQNKPAIRKTTDFGLIGIEADVRDSILSRISVPAQQARGSAIKLRSTREQIAYKPSLLRQYPLVSSWKKDEHIIILPELVMLRSTSNVFYDLVDATGGIKNEVSNRFEIYSRELLSKTLKYSKVSSSISYKYKGQTIAGPDTLCYHSDQKVDILVENKATRMSFEAKFAANPLQDAATGYKEIAKGIFQIWRFISHRRRQLVAAKRSLSGSVGLILTLDSWLTMSDKKVEMLELARELALKDPEISRMDDVPVIFVSIDELEETLRQSTEDSFYDTIEKACNPTYDNWMLSRVHADLHPGVKQDNAFPFENRMDDVLPWWSRFKQEIAGKP